MRSRSGAKAEEPHRKRFKPGETVPWSGIYSVEHGPHRSPHEVIIFAEELFPSCRRCGDAGTISPDTGRGESLRAVE